MIRQIWLLQPLAFARVGSAVRDPSNALRTALANFAWTKPDLRPSGTARTAICPAQNFDINESDGTLEKTEVKDSVLFKDEDGILPVCPFFELHGEWTDNSGNTHSGAITEAVLRQHGVSLADIAWTMRHANWKAYSLTRSPGDRIEASVEFQGDDFGRKELTGHSPAGADRPLVPAGTKGIPMGMLRAIRPSDRFPGIRLRFYPPSGDAFGPKNLNERIKSGGKSAGPISWLIDRALTLFGQNSEWKDWTLPEERCVLNENAAWPQYKLLSYREVLCAIPRALSGIRSLIALSRRVELSELLRFIVGPKADVGKLPPGLYASWRGSGAVLSSLGIIDGLGDGIISCSIPRVAPAFARIVVGPPHFSPDRRPVVSIADNLADRELRADPRAADWATGRNFPNAEAEIDDLLDRAFETAGASNLDAWAVELQQENASDAVYRGDENKDKPPNPKAPIWPNLHLKSVMDLPLTDLGRWRHNRNSADEFFEQLIRDETPETLIDTWIRNRSDPRSVYYDKKMPALMRGSDRRPMHLTRRQFEAFQKWAVEIRARKPQRLRGPES